MIKKPISFQAVEAKRPEKWGLTKGKGLGLPHLGIGLILYMACNLLESNS